MNSKERNRIIERLNELRHNVASEKLEVDDAGIIELAAIISTQDEAITELAEIVSSMVGV